MKYVVAEGDNAHELGIAVAEWLELNYRPSGGVSVCVVFRTWENERKGYMESETEYTYSQAMVLIE
jgi:hypothetical protein